MLAQAGILKPYHFCPEMLGLQARRGGRVVERAGFENQ